MYCSTCTCNWSTATLVPLHYKGLDLNAVIRIQWLLFVPEFCTQGLWFVTLLGFIDYRPPPPRENLNLLWRTSTSDLTLTPSPSPKITK